MLNTISFQLDNIDCNIGNPAIEVSIDRSKPRLETYVCVQEYIENYIVQVYKLS